MIKIGQRWMLKTSCHSVVVEIVKVEDEKFGSSKIVQVLERSSTCRLDLTIGRGFSVVVPDGEWEYLVGQDAP